MSQLLDACAFPKLRKLKLILAEDEGEEKMETFKSLCKLRMVEFVTEIQAIAI